MPTQPCSECTLWKRFALPKDQNKGVCSSVDHKKELYPDRDYEFRLVTLESDTCSYFQN